MSLNTSGAEQEKEREHATLMFFDLNPTYVFSILEVIISQMFYHKSFRCPSDDICERRLMKWADRFMWFVWGELRLQVAVKFVPFRMRHKTLA